MTARADGSSVGLGESAAGAGRGFGADGFGAAGAGAVCAWDVLPTASVRTNAIAVSARVATPAGDKVNVDIPQLQ